MSYDSELLVLSKMINECIRELGQGKNAKPIDLADADGAWDAEGRDEKRINPYRFVTEMVRVAPWKIECIPLGNHKIRLSRVVSTEN